MDWLSLHLRDLDWEAVAAALPFAPAMKTCIQDPVFHAEGDVWTHTRMVCEALLANPSFHSMEDDRKSGLFLAALLHDIAKPWTREVTFDPEFGRERTSHRGHSLKGAKAAWTFLWREGVDRQIREQVFALILWHQRIFHILSKEDSRREIILFSLIGRWSELTLLARADNRGRISPNGPEVEDNLELVRMLAEEEGCLDQAWPFETREAMVRFARGRDASAFFTPQPAAGSRVIVLSGPPGSGKDTYAAKTFPDTPVVSLDGMREKLGIKPGGNDGRAIQEAYEEAKRHLRKGTPFIWNATNLSKLLRDKIIDLCLAYDAFVEIHAIDRSPSVTFSQNRGRDSAVAEGVIDDMLRNWEPPTPAEAHALVWTP